MASVTPRRSEALIRCARTQADRRVVVLVEEYDAPPLNVVDNSDLIDVVRKVMREFYISLKACDADLCFVFLTGITKFSQLSIFSELNNLHNISREPAYVAICAISGKDWIILI